MLAQLLQEANRLPQVPKEAAQAYQEKIAIMEEWVNQEMEAHPEIIRLIGSNPLSMMHDNHHNHARFMANVSRFNAYELLAKTVVWVYRTYHAHGFSFDYFPLELVAWQRAVAEYLEVPQRQAITAVYQWMLDRHQDMVALSQEMVPETASLDPSWQTRRDAFLQALLHGDSIKCLAIGQKATKTPSGFQAFYLEVIQPCMYEIGNLWEQGEISVAQEHLASAIISRLTAVVQPSLELAVQPRGRAVVTAAPNEFHETGARCVADFLALDGWQVDYLGANTPQEELLTYLSNIRPNLLAVSMTMPFDLGVTQDLVSAIRKQTELSDLKVMVGGQAFKIVPDLWKITGADGYAPDARGAMELARKWQG